MENKKEKRKVSTKTLIAALLVLVLLLASVLGFTLARYITQGDPGSAGVGIAHWEIVSIDGTETGGTGTAGVGLQTFSPVMQKYDSSTHNRAVSQEDVTILEIRNNGDVDAYVFLNFGTGLAAYGYNEDGTVSDTPIDFSVIDTDKNKNDPTSEYYYAPWGSQLNEIFSLGTREITVEGEDAPTDNNPVSDEDSEYNGAYLVPAGCTLTVKTNITWNTDLDADTGDIFTSVDEYGCVYADYRDTWIGENIAQVGYSYTWHAVQGSQIPEAQP